jgi:hypothetical protein
MTIEVTPTASSGTIVFPCVPIQFAKSTFKDRSFFEQSSPKNPYASQQQTPLHRRLEQARKIGMRLGGNADLLAPFPGTPKGMHRRTFLLLRARAEAALCASKPSAY